MSLLGLFAAAAVAAGPTAPPVVATADGQIMGQRLDDGRMLFQGIPFAAPPVGDLRWRPPQPPRKWQGQLDATKPRPACPQVDYGWNHDAWSHQSEDCLYVEAATPNLTPAAPLPVMVWIHGGGNRAGAGAGAVWSDITKQGVVLVDLQYRLGALGFMSHPALSAESPQHASGNYALMDQQAALRWVQVNIARFGGDPRNVTIFGESAGGQDVGLQILSPPAHGLFAKAAEESGTAGFGVPPRTLKENEAVGEQLALKAGAPAHASAADLRHLPVEALLKASDAVELGGVADNSFIWLQAVIDGVEITEAPQATLERGGGSDAPLLIGVNARELSVYGGIQAAHGLIARRFGASADPALSFYGLAGDRPVAADPRLGDLEMQVGTDLNFRCPAIAVARDRVGAGRKVWLYQYDYTPKDGSLVRHAAEVSFVLGAPPDVEASAPPMQAYWVRFAKTGDPNGDGLTPWMSYDDKGRNYLGFINGAPQRGSDLRRICDLTSAP